MPASIGTPLDVSTPWSPDRRLYREHMVPNPVAVADQSSEALPPRTATPILRTNVGYLPPLVPHALIGRRPEIAAIDTATVVRAPLGDTQAMTVERSAMIMAGHGDRIASLTGTEDDWIHATETDRSGRIAGRYRISRTDGHREPER